MFFWIVATLCVFAGPPKESSSKWVRWKPHRHPFEVYFPAKPNVEQKYQLSNFGDLEIITASHRGANWGYIASFVYYPSTGLWEKDPDSFLQLTAKGIVANVQGAFPANNYFPVNRGSSKGVSFLFQVNEQDAKNVYHVQLFLVDNALIQLMVYNRAEFQAEVNASMFFSSFKPK